MHIELWRFWRCGCEINWNFMQRISERWFINGDIESDAVLRTRHVVHLGMRDKSNYRVQDWLQETVTTWTHAWKITQDVNSMQWRRLPTCDESSNYKVQDVNLIKDDISLVTVENMTQTTCEREQWLCALFVYGSTYNTSQFHLSNEIEKPSKRERKIMVAEDQH